jgi:hypothetical protein
MQLPRKQAAVVRDAIERWKRDGVIPEAQAATLAATIEVQYFDWRKLAKYSFWVALFSIITSVSASPRSSIRRPRSTEVRGLLTGRGRTLPLGPPQTTAGSGQDLSQRSDLLSGRAGDSWRHFPTRRCA